MLKNTAENEAGEGKQTARESNLSQEVHRGVKQTEERTFLTVKYNFVNTVRKFNQLCFRQFNTFYNVFFLLSPPYPPPSHNESE